MLKLFFSPPHLSTAKRKKDLLLGERELERGSLTMSAGDKKKKGFNGSEEDCILSLPLCLQKCDNEPSGNLLESLREFQQVTGQEGTKSLSSNESRGKLQVRPWMSHEKQWAQASSEPGWAPVILLRYDYRALTSMQSDVGTS